MTPEELAQRTADAAAKIKRHQQERDARRQANKVAALARLELDGINATTAAGIRSGFTVNGKTFSSSDTAQLKWVQLYTGRELLSYPITVATKDDTEFVDVIDAAEVVTYYTALLQHIQSQYSIGILNKKNRS